MEKIINAVVDIRSIPQDWFALLLGFFGPLVGVLAGARFTSNITEKQVKDNNRFIIFNNTNDKILLLFDEIHSNINIFLDTLIVIDRQLDLFNNGLETESIKFEYENMLNKLILINNSIIEKLNHLGSIHNLLLGYFGETDFFVSDFKKTIIDTTQKLFETFTKTHDDLKDIYNLYLDTSDSKSFIADSKLFIKMIDDNKLVNIIMKSNVGVINDFLNAEIIKLIKIK